MGFLILVIGLLIALILQPLVMAYIIAFVGIILLTHLILDAIVE